jgi:hypothetical protein
MCEWTLQPQVRCGVSDHPFHARTYHIPSSSHGRAVLPDKTCANKGDGPHSLLVEVVSFAKVPLVVFDLDGTLAASKSSLDAEMLSLLHELLGVVKVAVISGGAWLQFERQMLSKLP